MCSVLGYMELVRKGVIKFIEKIDICVPSSNFGNILGTVSPAFDKSIKSRTIISLLVYDQREEGICN